ncbi:hypothetical protein ACE6H2_004968 [Prunus campanulata]
MGQGQSDGNAGNSNSNDIKYTGFTIGDNSGYTVKFTTDDGVKELDIRPEVFDRQRNAGNFVLAQLTIRHFQAEKISLGRRGPESNFEVLAGFNSPVNRWGPRALARGLMTLALTPTWLSANG